MYDEELIDRGLHPCFNGKIKGVEPVKLVNSSCGDELSIYLKVQDGKILNGRWSGNGCAISLASADVFIESVIGKTIKEAEEMSGEFSKMILGGSINEKELGAAKCMKCVSRMPARANCAKLAWKSLEKIA
ncbi:SUF system NifU family Fe-S cluster assembly protein [Candidatus Saccharibacteria bacterium]|nr:SUF system NifU family Fe-S cluster assembly protein [Candidatus Saccharibacteria bacterium]